MAEILESAENTFHMTFGTIGVSKKVASIYGTVEDADSYFYAHPKYDVWNEATREEKWRYLAAATRSIDRLNFVASKASVEQILQFPRQNSTDIPVQVEQATYELALKFLEGFDPDTEGRQLSVRGQGYGGAKTEFDRSWVPDYVRAGIPSQTAWNLLYAFLRDPHEITLLRTG